jgi:hypothetical protein
MSKSKTGFRVSASGLIEITRYIQGGAQWYAVPPLTEHRNMVITITD